MKNYKNGQIVTIKGKKYRIVRGFCVGCAFWEERKKLTQTDITRTPWACRVYCEKEHIDYDQMFIAL